MYGGNFNRGFGPILPACGEAGEPTRGATPAARGAPSLAEGGRVGGLGQWGPGSENSGMKAICLLYYSKACSPS